MSTGIIAVVVVAVVVVGVFVFGVLAVLRRRRREILNLRPPAPLRA